MSKRSFLTTVARARGDAEQLAEIATACGIPTAYLHHSMAEARIQAIRARYEQDSGDLQGIVHLKMLGQGYDFPPITVVVPMRPYGSFGEIYHFIGRGIRAIRHPALLGRVGPERQILDIVYHAEMGLDEHIEAIYRENDMDPRRTIDSGDADGADGVAAGGIGARTSIGDTTLEELGELGPLGALGTWETYVLFERGGIERRIIHDAHRVEQRRAERELAALAQHYAAYAASSAHPVTFEEFARIMGRLRE